MNVIIYGASGQDGFYMADLLADEGVSVTCVSRSPVPGQVRSALKIVSDVADKEFVAQLIHDQKPDFIFNFAAESNTAHKTTLEHHRTIAGGTMNILDAVDKHSRKSRVFLSGSALQFANAGRSILEGDKLTGESTYAAARNYTLFLAQAYRRVGLKIYFGFFFHHESPHGKPWRQSQKAAATAMEAKATGKCELSRNVFTSLMAPIQYPREWNFAGDIMEAVWALVNQENIFEACLGSGLVHLVSDFTRACFEALGLELSDFIDGPERYSFPPKLAADSSLIRSLGWEPKVSMKDLARMMVTDHVTDNLSTPAVPEAGGKLSTD